MKREGRFVRGGDGRGSGVRELDEGLFRAAFLLFAGLLAAAIVLCSPLPGGAVVTEVRDSMVKIYAVKSSPDYDTPWVMFGSTSVNGSGCVIEGNRILTNAHVVSYNTYVQVRVHGRPEKQVARVLAVSHEMDLALLEVEDPSFFEEVPPLALGNLPSVQEEVVVYGFPEGGDTLSLTKGVVSRIEHQDYVHSSYGLLAGQVDAAINPGNSGGPVMVGDRIVGVVMQGRKDAQNIGYMVPTPVIRHFLADLEDGRHDGVPAAPFVIQNLESEALRAMLGMKPGHSGVLVVRVVPGTDADGKIFPGDVILSADGRNIGNDGTVAFRPKERTKGAYLFQTHQLGERISLGILRDGKEIEVSYVLTTPLGTERLVPNQKYDVMPSYFIYGGLLFNKLSLNYLFTWGDEWYDDAPPDLLSAYTNGVREVAGEEVVLLQKVLPAGVNEGYHDVKDLQIVEVNGKRIHTLRDLMKEVENPDPDPYMIFTGARGSLVVLNRERAEEERDRILETYRVLADRSIDFQDDGAMNIGWKPVVEKRVLARQSPAVQ